MESQPIPETQQVIGSALKPKDHTSDILNFAPLRDRIDLDKTIFKGIGHNGILAASRFDTGRQAHHPNDRIIYNPHTGALFYHAPHTPLCQEIEFAILAKHLGLSHTDFFVI